MAKLTRRLAFSAALVTLGACAPHFHFAQGPGTCSPMERSAYHRTGIMATTQKVQRLQARYSLSARYAATNPETWRSAAMGACR